MEYGHHRQPKSQGGTNQRENLVLLCLQCHGLFHGLVGVVGTSAGHRSQRADAAERWMQWLRSHEHLSTFSGIRALPDYAIKEWEEVYGGKEEEALECNSQGVRGV